MALGVRKGLAAAAGTAGTAGAAPATAKGLLSLAFSAFFAPATRASKLTRAELAPRKSSGDRLGFPAAAWAGDP